MSTSASRPVVTRFAPSPTGFLHIGGARTALFNWLYARAHNGVFKLRIEDTDRARSTPQATEAIFEGLSWLGLDYDGEAVSQFERASRHADIAHQLLAEGKAYRCFSTQDEIAAFREDARAAGRSTLFRSPWRDVEPAQHPDAPSVIRIKAPLEGETIIRDEVQGEVRIANQQLDDMILLRSDGTPVYMLAVVVDDYDMGVTHVIRGDDHLNNTARQMLVYQAMGWEMPVWAHIPLIHGADGKKMSKRHGALGAQEYRDMGFPAAAMRNYLARLGWSHGDAEFFTDEQAVSWFDFKGIGKSPARFDLKKLEHISGQHFKAMPPDEVLSGLDNYLENAQEAPISGEKRAALQHNLDLFTSRAKIYPDLIDMARFILTEPPFDFDEKAQSVLDDPARAALKELTNRLQSASWTKEGLETALNAFASDHDMKFGKLAAPLRAALSGRATSPSVFDMMLVLGQAESLSRLSIAAE